MKLHVLSNIHLEFAPFTPPETDADVVILAGDLHPGVKAIAWMKKSFPNVPVIFVPGNHEYYNQALPKHTEKLKALAKGTNIHVLDNDSLIIDDVAILGCTLWTDFDLFCNPRVAGFFATESMYDYKKIRVSPTYRRLRSIDTAGLHFRSRKWLEAQFNRFPRHKTVVVTHHAPSARSLKEGSENELKSAASASHMDDFVKQSTANLWVHGHMHVSKDYSIGHTHILCNPRGYSNEPNTRFQPGLVVEL